MWRSGTHSQAYPEGSPVPGELCVSDTTHRMSRQRLSKQEASREEPHLFRIKVDLQGVCFFPSKVDLHTLGYQGLL